MSVRLAILICAAALAACTPKSAPVRTVQVAVPVAVSCVPRNLPAASPYPDSGHALLSAADAAERYRLLILGREQRIRRLTDLEIVVAGCRE